MSWTTCNVVGHNLTSMYKEICDMKVALSQGLTSICLLYLSHSSV